MAGPVNLEQLRSSEGETFRQLYAIYAASIAAREQKGEPWIAAMVGDPQYRVWLATDGGVVRGFSILFVPAAGGFALLEYLGVAPEQRNRGLGATLFRQTVAQAVTPEGHQLPVVMEVDADREASSDRALRTRREQFYRRLGCRRIAELPYVMPLDGEGAPPEMNLFVCAEAPLGGLARSEVERWLETIYRDVYHRPPDDPRLAQMLAGLPDPVGLD